MEPTPASTYLVNLARRVVRPYTALPQCQAVLLAGSSAEGLSDYYSDIDMSIFYSALPAEDTLRAIRLGNNGSERILNLGDRAEGGFIESYLVDGVEVQLGHITVDAWAQELAVVLEQLDVASPLQKALDGTRYGLALYGAELVAAWKAQVANYPDALAEAMVRHYLRFFPLWLAYERLRTRDALLWRYQGLVEAAQNVLGVLAGLNRVYYSTFQFKRMRHFLAMLSITPPNLAARIEGLFSLDPQPASLALEALVSDVVDLVEQHMPQIDTSAVRARLGQRLQPWTPTEPLPEPEGAVN